MTYSYLGGEERSGTPRWAHRPLSERQKDVVAEGRRKNVERDAPRRFAAVRRGIADPSLVLPTDPAAYRSPDRWAFREEDVLTATVRGRLEVSRAVPGED